MPEGSARLHTAWPVFAGCRPACLLDGNDLYPLQLDDAALTFQPSGGDGDRTLQKLHRLAFIDRGGRRRWFGRVEARPRSLSGGRGASRSSPPSFT